jgi:hypothetical protein
VEAEDELGVEVEVIVMFLRSGKQVREVPYTAQRPSV